MGDLYGTDVLKQVQGSIMVHHSMPCRIVEHDLVILGESEESKQINQSSLVICSKQQRYMFKSTFNQVGPFDRPLDRILDTSLGFGGQK